jgi:hypothetical protein
MHLFFVVQNKDGSDFNVDEAERIERTIRRYAVFSDFLTGIDVIQLPRGATIFVATNEQSSGVYYNRWRGVGAAFCGICSDPSTLAGMGPSRNLADGISKMIGRFSAVTFSRRNGKFALAVPLCRVDSVYEAETDNVLIWGNQASVVSAIRDGQPTVATETLLSFISAGFFGEDAGPYHGVSALPPMVTVFFNGRSVERAQSDYCAWKHEPDHGVMDDAANAFANAFKPLPENDPITITLTGGKDSRLSLAGALSSGREVTARTYLRPDVAGNNSDIEIAALVAKASGVKHEIIKSAHPAAKDVTPDIWRDRTAKNIHGSDGMLSMTYPNSFALQHLPGRVGVNGIGGETLKGGYGEKKAAPSAEYVSRFTANMFNKSPLFFKQHAVDRYREISKPITARIQSELSPHDALDALYIHYRCGRWVAASSRASTTKFAPLLDNALSRYVFSMPASKKREYTVHKELLKRLAPGLSEIPFSAPPAKRVASEPKPPAIPLAIFDIIKRDLLGSGLISAVEPVINMDVTLSTLQAPDMGNTEFARFCYGLHAAATLKRNYV